MAHLFPPTRLADLDRRSAGAYTSLLKLISSKPVTLFLGSGVSASAGLPDWNGLLARICAAFFSHWEWRHASKEPMPPRDLSIVFLEPFEWDGETHRLAEEFAKGNPLLVAQQIKNCIRERDWRYLLNKTLYESPQQIQVSPLVSVLARLCADSRAVSAVVNFNFDSIFEDHLADLGMLHSVVWSADVTATYDRLSVLHPHGFLKRGGGPLTPLVLGEADYFESSRTPYAWPDALLIGYLSSSTCVFVGQSMTDPNVRRLLRVVLSVSGRQHFAFLPCSIEQTERARRFQALFDSDLLRLGVAPIRYPMRTTEADRSDWHSRLSELLATLEDLRKDTHPLRRLMEAQPAG
jgi:SIR2-like domain